MKLKKLFESKTKYSSKYLPKEKENQERKKFQSHQKESKELY